MATGRTKRKKVEGMSHVDREVIRTSLNMLALFQALNTNQSIKPPEPETRKALNDETAKEG